MKKKQSAIRIDATRQDTNHPDKRRRHQGHASCEVAGRRFETTGPVPIYKLATLLWPRPNSRRYVVKFALFVTP